MRRSLRSLGGRALLDSTYNDRESRLMVRNELAIANPLCENISLRNEESAVVYNSQECESSGDESEDSIIASDCEDSSGSDDSDQESDISAIKTLVKTSFYGARTRQSKPAAQCARGSKFTVIQKHRKRSYSRVAGGLNKARKNTDIQWGARGIGHNSKLIKKKKQPVKKKVCNGAANLGNLKGIVKNQVKTVTANVIGKKDNLKGTVKTTVKKILIKAT